MLTFDEWLAEYTQKYGTPPAVKMAEDAWNYLNAYYGHLIFQIHNQYQPVIK